MEDTGDSGRAESVASSSSSRSRVEAGADLSLVRRQSVIIEGLTLETDELRRRCQVRTKYLCIFRSKMVIKLCV